MKPDPAAQMARAHCSAAYSLCLELTREASPTKTEEVVPVLRRRLRDAFKASLRIRRAA